MALSRHSITQAAAACTRNEQAVHDVWLLTATKLVDKKAAEEIRRD